MTRGHREPTMTIEPAAHPPTPHARARPGDELRRHRARGSDRVPVRKTDLVVRLAQHHSLLAYRPRGLKPIARYATPDGRATRSTPLARPVRDCTCRGSWALGAHIDVARD